MDATMYLNHWEPSDEKNYDVPAPTMTVEREDDGDIYLRFKTGRSFMGGSTILVTMSDEQFQQFAADCARVAAQKNEAVK